MNFFNREPQDPNTRLLKAAQKVVDLNPLRDLTTFRPTRRYWQVHKAVGHLADALAVVSPEHPAIPTDSNGDRIVLEGRLVDVAADIVASHEFAELPVMLGPEDDGSLFSSL